MYFKLLLAMMILIGVLTGVYIARKEAQDVREPVREEAQEVRKPGEQLPVEKIEAKEIQWVANIAEGLKSARQANKPLLVHFTADWCPPCRKMAQDTYRAEEVIGLSRNFICVQVDTDKNPQVSREYKVTGLPTIIFLNPDGKVIKRVVGFRNSADFAGIMKEVMEGL